MRSGRSRRRLPVVLAALVAGAAGSALASGPGVRERAWLPLVRLVAGRDADAPAQARTRLRDGFATFGTLLHGLDADEATRAFWGRILEQLESFDLAALHEDLPEEETGGWRRVRFRGRSREGKYSLERVAATDGSSARCDPDGELGPRFGDLSLGLRSRKADGKDENFVGNLQLGLGFGNARWKNVLAALSETLRLFESTGPGAPAVEAARRPDKASLVLVKKDNPKCGPEDLELLALFREAFPRFYDHLRELYRTDDVLVYDPETEGWQQIHLVLALRRDAEKHRPIVEWLEGLGPLLAGRGEAFDGKGRPVATLRFSSKDLALTFDAFVANGKLCPVEAGRVLVDEGYDLEAVAEARHRDRWTLDMDVNGIATEIHDLGFKVVYETTPAGMRARVTCDEEPKVRVHGSAFGIIPTWAIDVVMPSNIEDLTRKFLHVLTRGNDGRGLVLAFEESEGKNGASVLSLDGSAEGLNNFLVRLGFKIARRKLIPPDEALDELGRYLRDGHSALTQDFETFAEDGARPR